MGLFTQRPEQNEEWAGLPSEPARAETEAERLAAAAPAIDALGVLGVGGVGGEGGAVESIVIPVAPLIDVAPPSVTDGDDAD